MIDFLNYLTDLNDSPFKPLAISITNYQQPAIPCCGYLHRLNGLQKYYILMTKQSNLVKNPIKILTFAEKWKSIDTTSLLSGADTPGAKQLPLRPTWVQRPA
jgi:hypothetical protein